jgi:RNA recognition motif. (a.k.a. RRM, RBD, or RNP domain)
MEVFGYFGKVVHVDMPTVDVRKRALTAYVEFATLEDAEKAIEGLDEGHIDGNLVSAKLMTAEQMKALSDLDSKDKTSAKAPVRGGRDSGRVAGRRDDRRGSYRSRSRSPPRRRYR